MKLPDGPDKYQLCIYLSWYLLIPEAAFSFRSSGQNGKMTKLLRESWLLGRDVHRLTCLLARVLGSTKKNCFFLGIIPKPADPPPSLLLGIKI